MLCDDSGQRLLCHCGIFRSYAESLMRGANARINYGDKRTFALVAEIPSFRCGNKACAGCRFRRRIIEFRCAESYDAIQFVNLCNETELTAEREAVEEQRMVIHDINLLADGILDLCLHCLLTLKELSFIRCSSLYGAFDLHRRIAFKLNHDVNNLIVIGRLNVVRRLDRCASVNFLLNVLGGITGFSGIPVVLNQPSFADSFKSRAGSKGYTRECRNKHCECNQSSHEAFSGSDFHFLPPCFRFRVVLIDAKAYSYTSLQFNLILNQLYIYVNNL